MRIKHIVWTIGVLALLYALYQMGVDRLSSWIQFASGVTGLWAAGEYIEQRPKVKQFIQEHREHQTHMKHHMAELHRKVDDQNAN